MLKSEDVVCILHGDIVNCEYISETPII